MLVFGDVKRIFAYVVRVYASVRTNVLEFDHVLPVDENIHIYAYFVRICTCIHTRDTDAFA